MQSITQKKLDDVCFLLTITFGMLFIGVGIDKFFNIITQWHVYVNPIIISLIPLPVSHFLAIFGIIQIIIGILILSPWTIWGTYSALFVLIGILINLMSMQETTIVIIHDLCMIILLVVLIGLRKERSSLAIASFPYQKLLQEHLDHTR